MVLYDGEKYLTSNSAVIVEKLFQQFSALNLFNFDEIVVQILPIPQINKSERVQ